MLGEAGYFNHHHHHDFVGSHWWGPVQPEEAAGTVSKSSNKEKKRRESGGRTTQAERHGEIRRSHRRLDKALRTACRRESCTHKRARFDSMLMGGKGHPWYIDDQEYHGRASPVSTQQIMSGTQPQRIGPGGHLTTTSPRVGDAGCTLQVPEVEADHSM